MAPDGTSPDTDHMAFPASADPNGQSPDGVPPPCEQDLSDRNQTLSDEDQTLSDRDQEASDEDQAASDDARDEGLGGASYERITAERAETSRERLSVGESRDHTASQRDELAEELDRSDELSDEGTLGVEELRARAAKMRKRAGEDRVRAAKDRDQAANNRRRAAHDRELAAHDRQQAGTDGLTGARRRGVGLEDIKNEIHRARHTGGGLVVAFVDVEGLKAINDELDHAAGDALLRELAKSFRRHVRSNDLVVHLGGDEFLCAIPGVTVAELRARLVDLTSELRVADPPGSVSFGLAELHNGESPDSLIDRADRDLLSTREGRQ
jgi:diguanylate cyclase (GGDEF)-like protein